MAVPTLHDIRYYDQHIHPDSLRKAISGWRVWYVVFLNWVRYIIETHVQAQVVVILAGADGFQPEKRRSLVEQFWADVRDEEKLFRQQSPLFQTTPEATLEPRDLRYRRSRGTRVPSPGDPLPDRPQSIDVLAARLGSKDRDQRYGRTTTLHEDFTEVKKEE